MFGSRHLAVLLGVLCAAGVFTGELHAGQCHQQSKASLETQMVQEVYPVADLVIPFDAPAAKPAKTTERILMTVIENTIDPQSWQSAGGKATLQYAPVGFCLAVYQTPSNQKKVAELLASLRRCQDVEVAVEMRVVTVSSHMAEGFKEFAGFQDKPAANPRLAGPMAFLSDVQVSMLMEAAQGDRRTNVMQAPKITLFNGQLGSINVGDEVAVVNCINVAKIKGQTVFQPDVEFLKVGLFAYTLPVVSADRRFVRLHLDLTLQSIPNLTEVVNKQMQHGQGVRELIQLLPEGSSLNLKQEQPQIQKLTLDKVALIPDCATVVYHVGKTVVEDRHEFGPGAGGGAYFRRLFTAASNSREERQREVFLMVTPRIIVNQEQSAELPQMNPK